jgi:histone-lysine N-methyltransferase SETD3
MATTAGAAEAAVAAAAAHAPANPAADPEFLEYCAAHGVRTYGIAPAFVAEGWRGIVATAPLAPGDVLLAAPAALLMSRVSAQRDPQLSAALLRVQQEQQRQQHDDAPSSSSPPLSDHQVLTLHLLHEASKGAASFWAQYVRQLPPFYTTLASFSPAAVEALQAPHAVAAARAAVERARTDWRGAWPVMQELGLPRKWTCLRAWLWASGAVLSRTMHLPGAPAGCLVPFGDLFNYRPPPPPFSPPLVVPGKLEGAQQHHNNDNDMGGGGADGDAAAAAALAGDGAFDAAAGEYLLRARRAYAPGEQVFLCYGRHTNLEARACFLCVGFGLGGGT